MSDHSAQENDEPETIEDWSAERLIETMVKEAEQEMLAGKNPNHVFRYWGSRMYVWWQCNNAAWQEGDE